METVELQVEMRNSVGKGAARATRRQGKVPAVLYGPKRPPMPVVVDAKEFTVKVANVEGSHLIRLQSPAPDIGGRLVLVKETQRDPVSRAVLHADLYEVDLDTKLRIRVPLHFVGRAAGVELGGILQPIQREVEVLCLPTEIPEFLEIDVSSLGIHDVVHVSGLKAPPGVEIELDAEEPLVTVLPPTVEEVKVAEPEAEAEAAAPAEGAEPGAEAAKPETGKGAAKPEAGKGAA